MDTILLSTVINLLFITTYYLLIFVYLQALQKGNIEGARIHGENAIRQKNQALNFRRMSSRVDAVSSRVQTAVQMRNVR